MKEKLALGFKVDKRQIDFCEPKCAALEPSVKFDLCPVELPVVVRHRCKLAFKRLHFFELVFVRVVAVSPAAYHQFFVLAAQAELGLVALCAARSHQRMAQNPLL